MALAKSALGWRQIAGLGVALVVAGQFSGWNYGLAHGWTNMVVATLLMAMLCFGLALCVAELSAAQPNAGGLYVYCEAAFGPFAGYMVGFAVFAALSISTGAAAEFISAYCGHIFGFGGWALKLPLLAVIVALHIRGVGEAMRWLVGAGLLAVACILLFDAAMLPHFSIANLSPPGEPLRVGAASIFACIPFAVWLSSRSSRPPPPRRKSPIRGATCRAASSRRSAYCCSPRSACCCWRRAAAASSGSARRTIRSLRP